MQNHRPLGPRVWQQHGRSGAKELAVLEPAANLCPATALTGQVALLRSNEQHPRKRSLSVGLIIETKLQYGHREIICNDVIVSPITQPQIVEGITIVIIILLIIVSPWPLWRWTRETGTSVFSPLVTHLCTTTTPMVAMPFCCANFFWNGMCLIMGHACETTMGTCRILFGWCLGLRERDV